MKTLRFILLTAALLFAASASAYAEDFLFKYKDGAVSVMSCDMEQTHVVDNVYAADDEEELKRLLEAGIIEYYEPNGEVRLMDVADDTNYTSQRSYEFKLTNAIGAVYNKTYMGEGVRVGIIDTGLADNLEDINYDNIVAQKNVVTNSSTVTDSIGHGTSVTGVIAAVTNNALGVASLAPDVELVIVKAFADNSSTTSVMNLVRALNYAIEQGCDVINMSVGATYNFTNDSAYQTLQNYVEKAAAQGIIIVAAAGNHDSSTPASDYVGKDSPYMYPASYNKVVSVASVGSTGAVSSFSYHNNGVNIAACGESVTVLNYTSTTGVKTNSGTSFSSPYIAAVAAIVKQINPNITVDEFISLLDETATDAGDEGWDTYYGSGIVNVGKLMDTLLGVNITLSEISFDSETWESSAWIINNGFDSYSLMDLWCMESEDGTHYNNKVTLLDISPRTMVGFEYYLWYNVIHMVWFQDSLQPVGKAEEYDTGIWG